MHTVALFALSGSAVGDALQLAGTGTLVVVGEEHYVLSAGHVWDKILRKADKLGISLREHVTHSYFMDIINAPQSLIAIHIRFSTSPSPLSVHCLALQRFVKSLAAPGSNPFVFPDVVEHGADVFYRQYMEIAVEGV